MHVPAPMPCTPPRHAITPSLCCCLGGGLTRATLEQAWNHCSQPALHQRRFFQLCSLTTDRNWETGLEASGPLGDLKFSDGLAFKIPLPGGHTASSGWETWRFITAGWLLHRRGDNGTREHECQKHADTGSEHTAWNSQKGLPYFTD